MVTMVNVIHLIDHSSGVYEVARGRARRGEGPC